MLPIYSYDRPKIPCLHKCEQCQRRLTKSMKHTIVCQWPDQGGIQEEWYCCEKCAAKAYKAETDRRRKNTELNVRIQGWPRINDEKESNDYIY